MPAIYQVSCSQLKVEGSITYKRREAWVLEGKQQSLPRLPQQRGCLSKQSSFMGVGPVQYVRPQGWVLGCALLHLLDPWTPSSLSFLTPTMPPLPSCSTEDLGLGVALQGLRSRPHFCRKGDMVAAIPTLDWQCYSSLEPTPDPGLKVLSPEFAMALGVVGLGSRSWGENKPGSLSLLWPRQCTSVWWLEGSRTQPWSAPSTC